MDCLLLKTIWINLCALRLILCILPQSGIVSDDEFSAQEKMSGHIFNILSNPKINITQTPQSFVFPALFAAVPLNILRFLAQFVEGIVNPYCLLLFPRLMITMFSFLADTFIFQIALEMYEGDEVAAHLATLVFASSHVSLVYCTRVLPEVFIVTSTTVVTWLMLQDKTPDRRQRTGHAISYFTFLAALVDSEVFVLMAIPVLYYVLIQGRDRFFRLEDIIKRSTGLIPGFLISLVTLGYLDCMYFTDETTFKTYGLKFGDEHFWFKAYRWLLSNTRRIFQSTDRSPYPHYMTFEKIVFAAFILVLFLLVAKKINWKDYFSNTRIRVSLFTVVSIFVYSYFFNLSRLTTSLCLVLYISLLIPPLLQKLRPAQLATLTALWVLFSIASFLFVGLMLEGGILSGLEHVFSIAAAHRFNLRADSPKVQFLFYHTPAPPLHMLNLPAKRNVAARFDTFHLSYDSKYQELEQAINSSLAFGSKTAIYLTIPASLPCWQLTKLKNTYNLDLMFEFFPHFSTFDQPGLPTSGCATGLNIIQQVLQTMYLNLYEIRHVNPTNISIATSNFYTFKTSTE